MFIRLCTAAALSLFIVGSPTPLAANEPLPLPSIEACATPGFDPAQPTETVAPEPCLSATSTCLTDENGVTMCHGSAAPGDAVVSCTISSDGQSTCDDLPPSAEEPLGPAIETITVGDQVYLVGGGHLLIRDGYLGASVGCNLIGGAVTIDGDRLTIVEGLMSTMMYCDELMEAEMALMTVLSGENLVYAEPTELQSDAGRISIATLCGDCAPTGAERTSSSGNGLLFGAFLLFLPALVGLGALFRGFTVRD